MPRLTEAVTGTTGAAAESHELFVAPRGSLPGLASGPSAPPRTHAAWPEAAPDALADGSTPIVPACAKKVLALDDSALRRLGDAVGGGLVDPLGCWQASELPGVLPP
jgi:hypothetical protein